MADSITLSQEIIKMVPVITGALIAGLITVISIFITHKLNEKKEKKSIKLQKIEELSRELSEYHSLITKQFFYVSATGNFIEEKNKVFHHVTLVNIYIPHIYPEYNTYIKEAQSIMNKVIEKKGAVIDVNKLQKLYSELMTLLSSEAKILVS